MTNNDSVDPSTLTVDDLTQMMPFGRHLGIVFTTATPERVEATMEWRPELCTIIGTIHGGAMMGFADGVGAACAYLNVATGQTTITIESKTNFLRLPSSSLTARCRPLSVGRRIIVVQTDMYDEGGKHVAQTTQTQTVQQLDG